MAEALHPTVNAEVARLPAQQREAWEERAAILEFEAGHAREFAEALALILVWREFSEPSPARKPEQLI